jgi:hypothetical protein
VGNELLLSSHSKDLQLTITSHPCTQHSLPQIYQLTNLPIYQYSILPFFCNSKSYQHSSPNTHIHQFTNCSLPHGHRHMPLANICFANISQIHNHTQSSTTPIHEFKNCSLPRGHSHVSLANICFANISQIHLHTQFSNTPIHQFTNSPIFHSSNIRFNTIIIILLSNRYYFLNMLFYL